jgi:glyoxylase I family protein
MTALRLHHLAVRVTDLDRALGFYQDLLGLEVIRHWDDAAGLRRSYWLRLQGDAFLAVERATALGPTRGDEAPGWHCVALAIDKAERAAWRDRLERGGHHVVRETAYTLYVRDPDDNLVGLSHYPEPSGE